MHTSKMRVIPSTVTLAATLLSGLPISDVANAQDYPVRPITMVVPFPAGGPTDVIGRIMADGMRPKIGQAIVIENVAGASGNVGVGRAARAGGADSCGVVA